jgi:hypothetical protein
METEKSVVKKSFLNMQERKGSSQTFPIPGELSKNWERKEVSLKELWQMNPQLYVGFKIDENSNRFDGDSGHLTLRLWRATQDSKAQSMTQALKALRDMNISVHPQIIRDMGEINRDLAFISGVSENNGIGETPLILLNESGVLPYTTGQVIDGNRRILALFESLTEGEIDDSMPVPIYIGNFPVVSGIAYNAVAFSLDNKPMDERVSLITERTSMCKHTDLDIQGIYSNKI